LEDAQKAVGEFGGDNRAGIEGTLHRISAIRSRKGMVVGLTCRVGRAVTGHVDMVRDLLNYKESILFLGRYLPLFLEFHNLDSIFHISFPNGILYIYKLVAKCYMNTDYMKNVLFRNRYVIIGQQELNILNHKRERERVEYSVFTLFFK